MTIPLEIRIGDLLAKFAAHTFGIVILLAPAWAIAALFFKPLANDIDYLFVLIQSYSHDLPPKSQIEYGHAVVLKRTHDLLSPYDAPADRV